MKSHAEKLQELKKMAKTQETIKKKWTKALLQYKQQQEALGNQVKTLIKEKMEKDNVLIDLELMNLKNVFLLNYEKLRRRTTKVKKEKLVEENKEYQRSLQQLQAQSQTANQKFGPNWCQEKTGGL